MCQGGKLRIEKTIPAGNAALSRTFLSRGEVHSIEGKPGPNVVMRCGVRKPALDARHFSFCDSQVDFEGCVRDRSRVILASLLVGIKLPDQSNVIGFCRVDHGSL